MLTTAGHLSTTAPEVGLMVREEVAAAAVLTILSTIAGDVGVGTTAANTVEAAAASVVVVATLGT